jgi:hypothetical protein
MNAARAKILSLLLSLALLEGDPMRVRHLVLLATILVILGAAYLIFNGMPLVPRDQAASLPPPLK